MAADAARSRPGSSTAAERAREVVGLYGDPGSTWGIGLDLRLEHCSDPGDAARRLRTTVSTYPHLGRDVQVETAAPGEWQVLRSALLSRPYAPGSPVVRLAVQAEEGRLMVAAHHGVCDGLGLVALAGAASGSTIRTRARGIGDRRSPHGFWLHSASRLLEALFRPPPRFPGSRSRADGGDDHLDVHELPPLRRGTGDLAWAVGRVFAERGGRGTPLLVVGASRRTGDLPEPDRRTAYGRLRVPSSASPDDLRARLATLDPEPDFPETDLGGLGPATVRLFRRRLGGTAVLSNLGVLDGPGILSAAMFPARSGPRAVVLGLATTAVSTTLTMRTHVSDFSPEETRSMLGAVARSLVEARQ